MKRFAGFRLQILDQLIKIGIQSTAIQPITERHRCTAEHRAANADHEARDGKPVKISEMAARNDRENDGNHAKAKANPTAAAADQYRDDTRYQRNNGINSCARLGEIFNNAGNILRRGCLRLIKIIFREIFPILIVFTPSFWKKK